VCVRDCVFAPVLFLTSEERSKIERLEQALSHKDEELSTLKTEFANAQAAQSATIQNLSSQMESKQAELDAMSKKLNDAGGKVLCHVVACFFVFLFFVLPLVCLHVRTGDVPCVRHTSQRVAFRRKRS